ncbi:MAG: hypothetical protein JWQ03_469 [Variovorax sp.]|nr:hypothetical protein [Variovorax sp.]
MNRCKSPVAPPLALPALAALCALLAASALGSTNARAQAETAPQTQNEAALGGRNFPVGTLRGKLMVVATPDIQLDGQADRLAPGARIRSAQHMLVMPAAITGQPLLVNYTRDAAGLVREVWILTPEEARAERAGVERPLLNFWPFVASAGPRDDGKTPFDQLPRYGQ